MKNATKKTPGGDMHQTSDKVHSVLTTNQGMHISDNQNSLKAGQRGPVLLEDFVLREKIFHFDHERIPERIVHARGSAAHGYFELYESLSDITKADILQLPQNVSGNGNLLFVRLHNYTINTFKIVRIKSIVQFAEIYYTVKVSDTRNDDSSTAV